MTEPNMPAAKASALRKPFPKESIGHLPKGGVMLEYVGHAAVTDRLLTVDPDWAWEPMAVGPDGLPAVDRSGNLWIRLTVCGVTRIGVGDGKSAKECIGDAIRNAAMRFGVALDLWAKENLVEFAHAANQPRGDSPPIAPPPTEDPLPDADTGEVMQPKTRGQLFALFTKLKIDDEDEQRRGISAIVGREVASRASLTEVEAKKVIGVLKQRQQRQEAPA